MRIRSCTSVLPVGVVRQRLEDSLNVSGFVEMTFISEGTPDMPLRFTVEVPTGDADVLSYSGKTWDGASITIHCSTTRATLTILDS